MATSGSVDFNQTRNEIIEDALSLIGIKSIDAAVSDEDLSLGNRLLNKMVKAWQAQGIHLWKNKEATLFLVSGTEAYDLGSTGDNASKTVVETTLSAAEASGQTVISVTTSTGMTASDTVLIEMDDGTLHSSTIATVDSATQITINDATDDDAASGNFVYTYTTKVTRPIHISQIRLRDANSDDVVMTELSREEYFSIQDKDESGEPTQWFYDHQLTNGKLYLYPAPDDVRERLKFTFTESIEDFDSSGDNPDFPQEWLEALTYNLALRLAPAFGKDQQAIATIGSLAKQFLDEALSFDADKADMHISMGGTF